MPMSGRSRPTSNRASVDLPLPLGPDERDPLAGVDPQLDVADDGLGSIEPEAQVRGVDDGTRIDAVDGADIRGPISRRVRPPRRSAARRLPAARSRHRASARPTARATSRGVPKSIGAAIAIERQDQVGHRPGGLDEVLDQDDGRRPLGAQGGEALHERGRARPDRGSPSARRGPGCRGAARARRPARGAAAVRPRAGASGAAPGPPGPSRRAPRARAARIAAARPAAVLEAERDVVLDPLHDELAVRVLPDHPDPRRDRGPVRARGSRGRRATAGRPWPPGSRAGSSPPIASASVLLPEPDGPTTSIVLPGRQLERDTVEGQPVGSPMADREVAGRQLPGSTVGRRQSGNPSSTPARLQGAMQRDRAPGHDDHRRDRHEHADGRAGQSGRSPRSR